MMNFFFSSRRRHTRWTGDWSSDVCSSDLVFLETDGTLLPRRIHEFQPLPQLFLTVRLRSFEDPGSAFAVEGLRAARLCGFFTAVPSPVHLEADLVHLSPLRAFLLKNDVDGWLITAGSSEDRKSVV